MNLKQFIQVLQEIDREINVNAHPKSSGDISFTLETDEESYPLHLHVIEEDFAFGCGCTLGAIIRLVLNDPFKLTNEGCKSNNG